MGRFGIGSPAIGNASEDEGDVSDDDGDGDGDMNDDIVELSDEEGDYYELFGWLLPLAPRPTISRTFPNFLYPDLKFKANSSSF